MRVAIVCPPSNHFSPPNCAGSVPIWIYQVARRLAHQAEVSVYSRLYPGTLADETVDGIRCYRIEARSNSTFELVRALEWQLRGLPPESSRWFEHSYYDNVAALAAQRKVDVVHLHLYPQFSSVFKSHRPSIRTVGHLHLEWLNVLPRRLATRALLHTDAIVACSQFLTDRQTEVFPSFADRFCTIYNGVDPGTFAVPGGARPRGEPIILYVGRLSPEKGLHVMLEAFEHVARFNREAVLNIVGPEWPVPFETLAGISEDPALKALARFYVRTLTGGIAQRFRNRYPSVFSWVPDQTYSAKLRREIPSALMSRVRFTGSVPYEKLVDIYGSSQVLVLPSIYETFGIPLVEAMATQLPVVASRVGGIPEVVADGETGLLVERGDAMALAEAIGQLLEDAGLRDRMGRAGRERVLRLFSWDRVATTTHNLYERLIAQRPGT